VTRSEGDAPLRYPITGIAGCCALAASGHAAAAPLSSVMNSRRLMSPSIELEVKRFFAPLDFLRREPPPGQSLNPRRSFKETPLPDSKGAEPLQSVNRSSTIRCHL
jgi:hypothetical protein